MNNNGDTQGAPKIKIDINDLPIHICPKCSHSAFSNAIEIRVLSSIISPSGRTETIKVPVVVCSMCGNKVLASDIEETLLRDKKEIRNVVL